MGRYGQSKLLLHFIGYQGDESHPIYNTVYDWLPEEKSHTDDTTGFVKSSLIFNAKTAKRSSGSCILPHTLFFSSRTVEKKLTKYKCGQDLLSKDGAEGWETTLPDLCK